MKLVILAKADLNVFVVPAKAGIHFWACFNMDSRLRGSDERVSEPGFSMDTSYRAIAAMTLSCGFVPGRERRLPRLMAIAEEPILKLRVANPPSTPCACAFLAS
ncbi:hypothetical protein BH09GEM1_BH09GEM1_10910 [soil metagenome]